MAMIKIMAANVITTGSVIKAITATKVIRVIIVTNIVGRSQSRGSGLQVENVSAVQKLYYPFSITRNSYLPLESLRSWTWCYSRKEFSSQCVSITLKLGEYPSHATRVHTCF